MPKSKRQRVTTLSKTPTRTTKASKLALVNEIRSHIDQYDHVWLFSVGDMRNEGLKDVRAQWRGTGRFFLGKTRVMAKALGVSPETEYEEGLGQLGKVCQLQDNSDSSVSVERLESSVHPIRSTRPRSGSSRGVRRSMRVWAPAQRRRLRFRRDRS